MKLSCRFITPIFQTQMTITQIHTCHIPKSKLHKNILLLMFMQAHWQDTSHLYNKDSLLGDFRIFTFDAFLTQVPNFGSKFESIYVIVCVCVMNSNLQNFSSFPKHVLLTHGACWLLWVGRCCDCPPGCASGLIHPGPRLNEKALPAFCPSSANARIDSNVK